MKPWFALLLLSSALLAGCSDSNDDGEPTTTTAAGHELHESFDNLATLLPDGWSQDQGVWAAVAATDARSPPKVLRGAGTDQLASLVADKAGSFTDVELTVSFKDLSGNTSAGVGVVIHYADSKNYQIIRYSPREQGWHLFTMVNGERVKQNDASVENGTFPAPGTWVSLKVESRGGHVTAFDGTHKVIDYALSSVAGTSTAGRVGTFVRADAVGLFDDFVVKPL